MRWIEESKGDNPKRTLHVLQTEPGEALTGAFVEFWKRILTEGATLPRGSRDSVCVEILARSGKEIGAATANFYTSRREENTAAPRYILRREDFVCARDKDQDFHSYTATLLAWQLAQYVVLKQALQRPEVWPLFEKLNAGGPLRVKGGGVYDWFDLQPGQEKFGALSASDRSALRGLKPSARDAFKDLTAGLVDIP